MTTRSDPAGAWRKSSYSGSGNNCVEVHTSHPVGVAVRDSKNPHAGVLTFTPGQWRAFTRAIRAGGEGQPQPR